MFSADHLQELFAYQDGALFWKVSRGPNKVVGRCAGGLSSSGYLQVKIGGKRYKAHRLIWVWHGNDLPDGYEVDHINGNALDNRIANLRLATHAQNVRNTSMRKDNTSGAKGVSWSLKAQRWISYVQFEGKKHYVGLFDDFAEAAMAAQRKREDLHGVFARHK